MLINRCWDSDDVNVGSFEVWSVGSKFQMGSLFQFIVIHFQRAVVPFTESVDARLVDIKADDGALLSEFHCKGQAYVSEADDCEFDVFQFEHLVMVLSG